MHFYLVSGTHAALSSIQHGMQKLTRANYILSFQWTHFTSKPFFGNIVSLVSEQYLCLLRTMFCLLFVPHHASAVITVPPIATCHPCRHAHSAALQSIMLSLPIPNLLAFWVFLFLAIIMLHVSLSRLVHDVFCPNLPIFTNYILAPFSTNKLNATMTLGLLTLKLWLKGQGFC